MVSCQDVSSNGTYLNGSSIHKSSVLVMDGDVIEIGTRSSSLSSMLMIVVTHAL